MSYLSMTYFYLENTAKEVTSKLKKEIQWSAVIASKISIKFSNILKQCLKKKEKEKKKKLSNEKILSSKNNKYAK